MKLPCCIWVYLQARFKEKHLEKTHCLPMLQIFITSHDSTVIKRKKPLICFLFNVASKKNVLLFKIHLWIHLEWKPLCGFLYRNNDELYLSSLFSQVERQDPKSELRNHISTLLYKLQLVLIIIEATLKYSGRVTLSELVNTCNFCFLTISLPDSECFWYKNWKNNALSLPF